MVNQLSQIPDKVALFLSLFRGRADVFPRRFQNRKSQKSGYTPVCRNEWVRNVCQKPKIKCMNCKHKKFVPVSEDVIVWHLQGFDNRGNEFVMGMYPMLVDETCYFLAVDFDKNKWEQDAVVFLKTCHSLGLSAVLERSRSGNGGHVWLFFEEAVSASLARKLGAHILTETMESNPELGLDSYDRFFPNQDTLPRGGFGNLIALPLQKSARLQKNSVFIDEYLQPYDDQWAYLADIKKITVSKIESVVKTAESKGRIVGVKIDIEEENRTPWRPTTQLPPIELVNNIHLVISNEIFIEKELLPKSLLNRLIRIAAFQNPEFYKAQAMRLPVYDKPRVIGCARDYSHHIGLPRGCLDEIIDLLKDLGIKHTEQIELNFGQPIEVIFNGALKPEQQQAVDTLIKTDIGVLSATTAFGKTVVAAWLIAKRAVNTLIIVHTKQLQDQWKQRIEQFLGIPAKKIGGYGGGRKKVHGIVDVALIQSLVKHKDVISFLGQYGHIIVDECHHIPSISFDEIVRQVKARYITGLSATLVRKDGRHPIITMRCGPVRYVVNAKDQAISRPFEHYVFVRPTSFIPFYKNSDDLRIQFQQLYEQIIQNESRNTLICSDIVDAVKKGRVPLVLTERNEHLELLNEKLSAQIKNIIVLRGGMGSKAMKSAISQLTLIPENEERLILATGKFVGEGFDDARLDTLFLTLPVSWKGTIAQYVGRLNRLHESKKEVHVYDYADLSVAMLEKMFQRRCKAYESVGYKILQPGSPNSGWPAEISLPSDPLSKEHYGKTISQLVSDGMDASLVQLFSDISIIENEQFQRARSLIEAFLLYRLETLPETKGHFKVNQELAIPFDAVGCMEVGFLNIEDCIAIEIDRLQHLSSKDAYRRDRHKDWMLQESGYLVLRFLAEDVSKNLDVVLDTILRAMNKKNNQK